MGVSLYMGKRVMEMGKKIYVRGRSKPVGKVVGDVFRKWVSSKRHFLRQPPAIAFDVSSLTDAKRFGATTVEVRDSDSMNIYRASIETVLRDGMRFDRGYGKQIALALGRWSMRDKKQMSLFG